MPTVRKLAPEEAREIENKGKGQRKLVEEEYDRYLADYAAGDYGEIDLAPNENRLTVRNRFKAAATRRGMKLDFRRTSGDMLRFKVVAGDDRNGHGAAADNGMLEESMAPMSSATVVPAAEEPPATPPKRRGGRPKKNA